MGEADEGGEEYKQRHEMENGGSKEKFAADDHCGVVAIADVAVGHQEADCLEEERQDVEEGEDWQEEMADTQ